MQFYIDRFRQIYEIIFIFCLFLPIFFNNSENLFYKAYSFNYLSIYEPITKSNKDNILEIIISLCLFLVNLDL